MPLTFFLASSLAIPKPNTYPMRGLPYSSSRGHYSRRHVSAPHRNTVHHTTESPHYNIGTNRETLGVVLSHKSGIGAVLAVYIPDK